MRRVSTSELNVECCSRWWLLGFYDSTRDKMLVFVALLLFLVYFVTLILISKYHMGLLIWVSLDRRSNLREDSSSVGNTACEDRVANLSGKRWVETKDGRMYLFNSVCLEHSHGDTDIQIVIYGTPEGVRNKQATLNVTRSIRTNKNFWKVTFSSEKFPPRTAQIRNSVAFFVVPVCVGNLNHFLMDVYVRLFTAIKYTNGLSSCVKNQKWIKFMRQKSDYLSGWQGCN